MKSRSIWRGPANMARRKPATASRLLCSTALIIGLSGAFAADVRLAGPVPGVAPGASVTALADGRMLIFGGASTSVWNPTGRHWESDTVADQQTRRSYHTATLSGADRLVFAGGIDMGNYGGRQNALNSTTIWNFISRQWEAGPGLLEPRLAHTAVALNSHDILVSGGSSSADHAFPVAPMLASAELLGEKTTVTIKPMNVARARHAALLLKDGRMLVTGGMGNDTAPLRSTEIYDPARNEWSSGPELKIARSAHGATLLADGRVLISGGLDASGQAIATTEIWKPGESRWQAAGALAQARAGHDALLLDSGDVLVSGGEARANSPAQAIELWRAAAASWSSVGTLPLALRNSHTIQASNGRILVFGQDSYQGSSLLTWLPDAVDRPSMDAPMGGSLTQLQDGRFLLAGGHRRQTDSAAVDIYDPASRQWSAAQALRVQRSGHRAVLLRDGRVLVLGGKIGGLESAGGSAEKATVAAEIWDPKSARWSFSRSLTYPPGSWSVPSLLTDGRVSLSAIDDQNTYADTLGYVRVWNPADDSLGAMTTLTRPWSHGRGLLLADGSIVYAGGAPADGRRMDVWNPLQDGWRPLAAAPTALAELQLSALADGGLVAWQMRGNAQEKPEPLLRWHLQSGWQSLPPPPLSAAQSLQFFSLPQGDLLLLAAGRESWLWNQLQQTWRRIAHEQSWIETQLIATGPGGAILGFHSAERSDSGFPHIAVSRLNLAAGRWQPHNSEYVPRDRPGLIDLGNGSIMIAGGNTAVVQLWNAARDEWQFTSFLPQPLNLVSGARLADGRVMLVGMGQDGASNALFCHLWQADAGAWSDCGRFIVAQPESSYPSVLRPLDKDRVLLVYGKQHALLWSQQHGWTATKLQLPVDQGMPNAPATGTPYLLPLASAWDPSSNSWIDATDVFFINALRLSAARMHDGSVVAIVGGAVYRWDPAKKVLSSLLPQPPPVDRAMNALIQTVPGCIAAWNDRTQQSLPLNVLAAMPNLYAGDLSARTWRGNPDVVLTPTNATAIGLADGTVLVAGNSPLPTSAGHAVQRFKVDCKTVTPLDPDRGIYLPIAVAASPAATSADVVDAVKPFRPPTFPQRWLNELRSQFWGLPQLWFLKVLAAMAVLLPLKRFAERWETYVDDEQGRSPGRRVDIIIVSVMLPLWLALLGLPNHWLKINACVLLAIAAFVSGRRLWFNASDARQRAIMALPLACAWLVAIATLGTVFANGVTRWFSFLTDYS